MKQLLLGSVLLGALSACTSTPAAPETQPGPNFLARNAAAKGVVTTPSGLQYFVVRSGPAAGRQPGQGDTVVFDYEGKLVTGETFDSSYARGQPIRGAVGDFCSWLQRGADDDAAGGRTDCMDPAGTRLWSRRDRNDPAQQRTPVQNGAPGGPSRVTKQLRRSTSQALQFLGTVPHRRQKWALRSSDNLAAAALMVNSVINDCLILARQKTVRFRAKDRRKRT